jgi:hypothetical protein
MIERDQTEQRKETVMKDDKRRTGKERKRESGRWCNGSTADF